MKLRLVIAGSAVALLLGGLAVGANASSPLGPDLPLIGDANLASKLVKAGNDAVAVGNIQEAKVDYQQALAACFTYEPAALGAARCAVAEGDLTSAITYYRKAVYGHNEDDSIDLITEYVLVLNQAGQGQEAVTLYVRAVDLCKKGYAVNKMDAPLPIFRLDGSNYDSVRLQAMTHLIRAINSSNGDEKRVTTEIQKAMSLAPASDTSVIYFYQGVLRDQIDKTNAGVVSDQLSKTNSKANPHQVTHQTAKAGDDKTAAAAEELKKMVP